RVLAVNRVSFLHPQPVLEMPRHSIALASLLLLAAAPCAVNAQAADSSVITLDRIYNSDFFRTQQVPPTRWTPDGQAYFYCQRRPDAKGPDIVRINPEPGDATTLVKSEQLTPAGDSMPLRPQSYRFSDDNRKLLLFTNTARVWRQN